MTSALLLGVVASSLEATIYLFHNGRASDNFNLTAI
jgi:putative hemolysin